MVGAAGPRHPSPAGGRRPDRRRQATNAEAASPSVADGTPPPWEVLSARQVDELIPGTMSFRETRPMTFALLVGFGSTALLLAVVIGVAVVSSSA
ncbi:hypothetical protein Q0F99_00695 [Rathayibacter oskolensis]|uniref:hypothetical protein n=1 Tax=Rathayibacter oskolensis TaxID=1891671 RepID=UPI0026604FA3|nr:hypothetical protein [Rathayibacter oskolensis]WKK71762.1 hypothetical protein Q0F99_00695 [Rathayibacter oskolensis]